MNQTQIWTKINVKGAVDTKMSARYGHKSVLIHPHYVFIFGGINSQGQYLNDMYLFCINEERFIPIKQKFSIPVSFPEPRAHFSMVHIGNGIVALYGGEDQNGVEIQEYWHLKVDIQNKRAGAYLVSASSEKEES